MSRTSLKFLPNQTIENITEQRIRELEKIQGKSITFPIPLESIVEQVLDLSLGGI